jgi:hypothetical protein
VSTHRLLDIIGGSVYVGGALICVASILMPDAWARAWWGIWPLIYAVNSFFFAVEALIDREWIPLAIYSFWTIVMAYLWWNDDDRRKRRKKLAARVAGHVVVTAAGLKVQPNVG